MVVPNSAHNRCLSDVCGSYRMLQDGVEMQSESDICRGLADVDFLIVTALSEERDAVLRLLEDSDLTQVGGSSVYYVCTLSTDRGNCKVAVTQLSQMGNVESGMHTSRAIDELHPQCVLMVGIAAGVRGKVNLGDVIISTQVIYYEQAKQTSKGFEHRPIAIPADHLLLHSAQNFNDSNWYELITTEMYQHGEFELPKVHFGPFAVGDKVVADQSRMSALMGLHSKLIGVEMESYGVAAAAASAPSRPRFLAIRGVCDFADEQKSDDFHEYAAAVAAAYAIGFLRSGLRCSNISTAKTSNTTSARLGSLIAIYHMSMQYIPPQTTIGLLPSEFAGRDIIELLIDQSDLYIDGRLFDPVEAVARQTGLEYCIDHLLDAHPSALVAYFGIAHVPLLFCLGYRLTNKRRLHFFEFDRYTGCWEYLQGEKEVSNLKLDGLPTRVSDRYGDVLIRISVSNTVRLDEVREIVPSPIASLHLQIQPSARDALVSKRQLRDYGTVFRQMLDSVHEFLPNRGRTHIFYAGPVCLAVYFGQLITQTIDRNIVVYNYTARDLPRYSWGLEVTAEPESPGLLIQAQK